MRMSPRDHGEGQADVSSPKIEIPVEQNSFVRAVQAVLERTEYRRCDSGEDFEDICRLRYKAYHTHGFVGDLPDQALSDSMDELPNSYCFGVFVDGELVSTVRLHHLTLEHPHAPVMQVFGDVLQPRLEQGETFINPSQLAADPGLTRIHKVLPYVTLRLALIASHHFETAGCINLIRREHTSFYKRVFRQEQVGEPRTYPPFTVPVMLYNWNVPRELAGIVRRFPFFRSTAMERRLLFSSPRMGEPAPLTVLPTAHYTGLAA